MHKTLIYHIYVDGDPDTLAFNLAHLSMYADKVDKIYFKLVYDKAESLQLLKPYLDSSRFDQEKTIASIYQNDPKLGENIGLLECLTDIKNTNPDTLILIGGASGVSKKTDKDRRNVRAWVRALIHLALFNTDHVEQKISEGFHCYGSFKRDDPMDKGGPYPCPWHYSGLFYWINGTELFKRNWDTGLAPCRHGVEMYPGYIFKTEEAYCHFNTFDDMYQIELQDLSWISKLVDSK